jgi:hypothetical protein
VEQQHSTFGIGEEKPHFSFSVSHANGCQFGCLLDLMSKSSPANMELAKNTGYGNSGTSNIALAIPAPEHNPTFWSKYRLISNPF